MRFGLDAQGDVVAPVNVAVAVQPRWVVQVIALLLATHAPTTESHIEDIVKSLLRQHGAEGMQRYPTASFWTKRIKDEHEQEALRLFRHIWPGVPVPKDHQIITTNDLRRAGA